MIRLVATLAVLGIVAVAAAENPPRPDLSEYEGRFAHWEESIAALEALDAAEPDPAGAVLLLGSSSIRRWDTAADDLTPYPVIRRGYGGARFYDLAHFAERLITPHEYRAAVIFVGNDISGGKQDVAPEVTGRLFGYVADLLTSHQPGARVICCDVRPAPSRFHLWDRIQGSNRALRAECDRRPNVSYLDTAADFLTADGTAAREDYYGPDRLHLSPLGTQVWSKLIKAELDRVLTQ